MRSLWLVCILMVVLMNDGNAQLRPDVTGVEAAVTADHPLAASAGADVLRRGGNAMDAAITMAAVLAVVRPHMSGVGGDAFLLYRHAKSGRVYALNGSGRAGAFATPDLFRERGLRAVPDTGMLSVTVPGAVRAWSDALRRFGTYGLAAALEPASRYAENGFPVSRKLAADLAADRAQLERDRALADVFLPGNRLPLIGELLVQKDLARTLRVLATEGADALYAGTLARRVAAFSVSEGGLFTWEDLANHSSTWQEPIATDYGSMRVYTTPPNSQGIALLMQLNVAELLDLQKLGQNSARYIDALVEVKKRVFAQRDRLVGDPAFFEAPLERLLSREQARDIARDVDGHTESEAGAKERSGNGDTVFMCAVDKDGNAVALIQSLYSSFGSGRMVPGTGIVLHNRGALFTLAETHINVVAPNKRPYHTLAPALVTRGNDLYMVLGSPGSDGQTQTLLQVLNNITLFGLTPQEAVDAPRYRSYANGALRLDSGIDARVRAELNRRGHRVIVQEESSAEMGGAQVILVLPSGVRMVGSDHRREAFGIAW
ncbi:MAG: gamma-glutamyltransferase [Gemmatimonadota bacterium]